MSKPSLSGVGDETRLYELPKSTFEQFARLRPDMVRSGYGPESIFEEEGIGPYQIVKNRFWFGKSFHDGEGYTGIGGFGYFDPRQKTFCAVFPSRNCRVVGFGSAGGRRGNLAGLGESWIFGLFRWTLAV